MITLGRIVAAVALYFGVRFAAGLIDWDAEDAGRRVRQQLDPSTKSVEVTL